ncbi:carbohydrate-binding family 9-like protein [Paraflavisolibacter sp. H34]|uniref:carbohydrate-binding family 9-like protein n=1 Tax=Huijunlia imazamoxiresistens TaxID=3127457 RepID=UPI00301649F0
MKELNVTFFDQLSYPDEMDRVAACLDGTGRHALAERPWPAFPYQPEVAFSLGHSGDCIFIKYVVTEACIRAVHSQPNAPVYQDSCVEFFIAFDEGGYYNFEFNCIGTCLAGFGPSKTEREALPEEVLARIRYQALLRNGAAGEGIRWELTVALPLEVFTRHPLEALGGRAVRANFYKCGDHLPRPHFVAWSPIRTEAPDFHRPEFFGSLRFA